MTNHAPLPRPLRGIVPPLITPLRGRDELDHDGLDRLVAHVLTGGVAGLFVLGTTGEGPSQSYRLRYELVERTCELAAGRAPVLVGVTDTSFAEAVDLARHGCNSGAAAVVAAAPYYFPMSQGALLRYFRRLADESPLPLFLYNMPSCVRVVLEPDTVARLAEHSNIAGIKDSSGDLAYFRELLQIRGDRRDWPVLCGPEHLLAETVQSGGDGGVCGGANLHPRLFVELFEAARHRDTAAIETLQTQVLQLGRIYDLGGDDLPVTRGLKAALAALQLCAGYVAEPFEPLNEPEAKRLEALLAETGLKQLSMVGPAAPGIAVPAGPAPVDP